MSDRLIDLIDDDQSKQQKCALKGRGIQIVEFTDTSDECNFNMDALKSVLCREEVRNKPACVISIVGPTSSGKTSLENYRFRFVDNAGAQNWIGGENDHLQGLDWRPTHRTVTKGIWIWDQPYITKTASGDECAVIFMDTEGLYGRDEVRGRWSHIFGISTAASSVQIFNLKEELTPRDMEELQVLPLVYQN